MDDRWQNLEVVTDDKGVVVTVWTGGKILPSIIDQYSVEAADTLGKYGWEPYCVVPIGNGCLKHFFKKKI